MAGPLPSGPAIRHVRFARFAPVCPRHAGNVRFVLVTDQSQPTPTTPTSRNRAIGHQTKGISTMSHIARDIVTKAAAMAAAAILCLVAIPSPAHAYPVDPVQYVNEDEPGWDCHTMGNHVCGPVADVPWQEQYPDEATQDATPPADDTGLFPDPFDGPEQEPFDIVGVDGVTHHGCTIEVDEPSSHLICDDGYAEES